MVIVLSVCEFCGQGIPDGVDRIVMGDFAACGPCLWDSYTPLWRIHQRHTGDYATCKACEEECGAWS